MKQAIQDIFIRRMESHPPGWYLKKEELLADLYRDLARAFPDWKIYREFATQGLSMWADLALIRGGETLLIELCYAPLRGHPALEPDTVVNPLTRRQIIDNIESSLMYIERFGQEQVLAVAIDQNSEVFKVNCQDLEIRIPRGLEVENVRSDEEGRGILFSWCSKNNQKLV